MRTSFGWWPPKCTFEMLRGLWGQEREFSGRDGGKRGRVWEGEQWSRLQWAGALRSAPAARGSAHPKLRPGPRGSVQEPGSVRSRSGQLLRSEGFFLNWTFALPPGFLFSDISTGKDFHPWGEFVSSLLNSKTESSKVLMCVFIFF